MLAGACHVALVESVAVSTCPTVGAVAEETFTTVVAELRASVLADVPVMSPVAVPIFGVVKTGEFANTAAPVPVSSVNASIRFAEEKDPRRVAFPVEVIAPVRFAFVVTVAALPVILPTIAFVTSKSVNQPLRILASVVPIEPVIVMSFAPKASTPEVSTGIWLPVGVCEGVKPPTVLEFMA